MTDNEIIKALKCFALDKDLDISQCVGCAFESKSICCENASEGIAKASLDLINRQQAEIERLKNTIISLSDYLDILGIDKTDTSIVRTATELNAQIRADVKAEAIKEFAERLKQTIEDYQYVIDNLGKEMVGDTE